MRKIQLDLAKLRVESFSTAQKDARRGTVRANETGVYECPSAYTGNPGCACEGAGSGHASCVQCPGPTDTCQYCSYTLGGAELCAW